jgi:hypothetical protein
LLAGGAKSVVVRRLYATTSQREVANGILDIVAWFESYTIS